MSDNEDYNEDEQEEEEEVHDLTNPSVVTKYREAGKISTDAIKHVMSMCKPGTLIVRLCEAGDAFIVAETGKLYKKGSNKKNQKRSCISDLRIYQPYCWTFFSPR